MRIGFDARTLYGKQGGIGRYATNLIKGLVSNYQENEYVLFRWKKNTIEEDSGLPGTYALRCTIAERILPHLPVAPEFCWSQLLLPIDLARRPVDLFHGVDQYIPLGWRGKSVVTIHDLSYKFFRDDFALKTRIKNHIVIPMACTRAKAVIVDSHFTANDLVTSLGVPKAKIHVIYLAVDEQFHVLDSLSESFLEDLKTVYGVQRPFILSVGDLRPRKNLLRLFQAFTRLINMEEFSGIQLAIVGKPLWGISNLAKYVRDFGLESRIRFLGYVPDYLLPQLYNAASLFVQPSLYEGFGFSALEALACGVPTAVSNVSSLPEVCSDGAFYFDPRSVEEITNAMFTVLTNGSLNQKLRHTGPKRAKMFSWDRTARETYAIYEKVFQG